MVRLVLWRLLQSEMLVEHLLQPLRRRKLQKSQQGLVPEWVNPQRSSTRARCKVSNALDDIQATCLQCHQSRSRVVS